MKKLIEAILAFLAKALKKPPQVTIPEDPVAKPVEPTQPTGGPTIVPVEPAPIAPAPPPVVTTPVISEPIPVAPVKPIPGAVYPILDKVTPQLLKSVQPNITNVQQWVDGIKTVALTYNISTEERLACFLATIEAECGFKLIKENLNYSAAGLRKTFGKYFPSDALAQQYARKPEMIANRVYANRMGNGNEASGDGWKARGNGPFQLTGMSNHKKFAASRGLTLEQSFAYLETIEGGLMSAGWFWDTNGLNAIADKGGIDPVSKRVNGGWNGIDHRRSAYKKFKAQL